jgi:hypothetical protein
LGKLIEVLIRNRLLGRGAPALQPSKYRRMRLPNLPLPVVEVPHRRIVLPVAAYELELFPQSACDQECVRRQLKCRGRATLIIGRVPSPFSPPVSGHLHDVGIQHGHVITGEQPA